MVLNAVFGFLLSYPPVIAVTLFCLIVSFLINIFYRILINQNDARQAKEKINELNRQRGEAKKAGKKEEVEKLQGDVIQENSRLMRMTMKPLFISFIIIIILLPWLASNYEVSGDISGDTGMIIVQGSNYSFSIANSEAVVDGLPAFDGVCDGRCYEVNGIKYEASRDKVDFLFWKWDRAKLATVVAAMPVNLPILGYNVGWLGWYIIVSVPIVVLIRKFMKIYV